MSRFYFIIQTFWYAINGLQNTHSWIDICYTIKMAKNNDKVIQFIFNLRMHWNLLFFFSFVSNVKQINGCCCLFICLFGCQAGTDLNSNFFTLTIICSFCCVLYLVYFNTNAIQIWLFFLQCASDLSLPIHYCNIKMWLLFNILQSCLFSCFVWCRCSKTAIRHRWAKIVEHLLCTMSYGARYNSLILFSIPVTWLW